ncbi:glycosyltransferase [Lacinutrix sp. C3R15]|uniref:glycosyltransferase family 2 protein n=1 Tax=Flavobacteriaceae TaxID=49546 RepID=UPI001C08355B|nr:MULTISPECIES: glycosyltransferase family 2 protein [Flavobacteriaceae]MBU2939572.1 glycosyltransferase [Lacinutrix sp. C3R15]MDO6622886.1 glycosyltransferase family 2 protein [Oceanihabitans sp. 1_MG-2023]
MQLSVIIPVYNGAEFIEKSYHSIINQQIEDFEILYVDNNSKDASVQNIQKLIAKDTRVKLFKQPKQGAAPARNLGIEKAIGSYVYIFDVDDEIYPEALHKMLAVLDGHPKVDAVFGKMVKSYKGIAETIKPKDETHNVIFKEKPFWGVHWFSSLKNVVGPPAFLYRKKIFKEIGLYNEELRIGQDTALDIKLGMTSNVAFLDTYVYLYFKHHASTIQQTKKNENMIFYTWVRLVKEHLPFYAKHKTPKKFDKILVSQIYSSMGKLIFYTKGYSERKVKYKEIMLEIKPLEIPFYLQSYLWLLILFPFSYILKFYVYYLVPFYIKHFIKKL